VSEGVAGGKGQLEEIKQLCHDMGRRENERGKRNYFLKKQGIIEKERRGAREGRGTIQRGEEVLSVRFAVILARSEIGRRRRRTTVRIMLYSEKGRNSFYDGGSRLRNKE